MSENENAAGDGGPDDGPDRSNENLVPKRAYVLSKEQGLSQREIAGMYDIGKSTVRRRIKEHEESMEVGKESVSASDFERDQLESALEDKSKDDDQFECSGCGKSMDYMEFDVCPNCDTRLGWTDL